jgi:hypothetical protein
MTEDHDALPPLSPADPLADPSTGVSGRPGVRVDGSPGDGVGHAVAAWHLATAGRWDEAAVHVAAARSLARTLPRRGRHAVAILTLAAEGHTSRAAGLAAEHVHDFPDDELIALFVRRLALPDQPP